MELSDEFKKRIAARKSMNVKALRRNGIKLGLARKVAQENIDAVLEQIEEREYWELIKNRELSKAHQDSVIVGNVDRLGRLPNKYDLFLYKEQRKNSDIIDPKLGIICSVDPFCYYEIKPKKSVMWWEKVLCNYTIDGSLVIINKSRPLSYARDRFGIVILDNFDRPQFCCDHAG